MANYTAFGREGDWGYTPPVYSFIEPQSSIAYVPGAFPTNVAYAIETYTPAGNPAGAFSLDLPAPTPAPTAPPPANNGAQPMSYYTTGGASPYYSPPAFTPSDSPSDSPQIQAPDISPNITPGSVGATPPALPAPTPQPVATPNFTPFQLTAAQLAQLAATPTLTPMGANYSPGYTPPPPPSSGGAKGSQSGGGGSAGGGPSPQPPQQQQQKQNPISLVLQNIFGRQNPLATTRQLPGTAAGGGGAILPPGATPYTLTPGGGYAGNAAGGSPAGTGGLFSPRSTNIWIPLALGGVLLWAATQK